MNAFEDHIQWNAVKEVSEKLREAGFEALLAGGCVRDLIMRREPNDFDIATNATPDEVEALFEKSIAVGKAFGVIVIPYPEFQIEVATFREDLEYKDGRRPEGVKFSTAKADAQRRDFTVNALFYDTATNKIIDYVDGRKDIAAKILRTVGDPNQRFDEDKLRILRALRFSAQLDFAIESQTLRAIIERAQDVNVVSRERIRDELLKLLKSEHRRKGLELLIKTCLLNAILPDLAKAIEDVETKWLSSFENAVNDETLLLALFTWPAPTTAQTLKLDNQTSDTLANIFKSLDSVLNPSKISKAELAYLFTKPFAPSLLQFANQIDRSKEPGAPSAWNEALKYARPDGSTPVQPLVTGKDLIASGVKPGPQMGERLHEIFLKQLEGKIKTKEEALAYRSNGN